MGVTRFALSAVTICQTAELTTTTWPDGMVLYAFHEDIAGLGQSATAAHLGYGAVSSMNKDHDPYHNLLAQWLGLSNGSPTLRGVATGCPYAHADIEEAAVLAIVRFALIQGVEVMQLLERESDGR